MKVILVGAPGSGKGTQAIMLRDLFNLKRISLGDIFREEVKKNTDLGNQVKGFMEKGLLVPDKVVFKVIEKCLNEDDFILDGYPRNLNQAKELEKILSLKNKEIDACIYLDVDEQTIVDRLSKRRVCRKCGANYHLENMPPKEDNICDLCQGELFQREDDRSQVIKKRWEVFIQETQKLLDFYAEKGRLLKVDAQGGKEEVLERIKSKWQK